MKSLIIHTFLVTLTVQAALAQDKDKTQYLASHAAAWNGEFKNAGKVFTPEILKNQLIMLGEGHGIARSYEIQADLLSYLKHKTGFRYLLQELGYCDGLLLNNYLQTGNEAKLQDFFDLHRGTFYWNQNIRDLYRRLYAINKNLPEKQKIVILPVDVEHNYRAGIRYLQTMEYHERLPEQLLKIDAANWKGIDIAAAYQNAYDAFLKNAEHHKTLLGRQYGAITYLMRNINETLSMALSGNGKRRDTVMLENFNYYKNLYHIQNQKMAGMFGTYHIRQVSKPDEGHFAGLLKASGTVKNIVSVMLCYSGGYIMMPKGYTSAQIDTARVLYRKTENTFPYIVESLEDGDLLSPYRTKNKGMMFNIAAPGSPFIGTKSFLVTDDQFASVDQLYQIIILINDSPAAEPIEGGLEISKIK